MLSRYYQTKSNATGLYKVVVFDFQLNQYIYMWDIYIFQNVHKFCHLPSFLLEIMLIISIFK